MSYSSYEEDKIDNPKKMFSDKTNVPSHDLQEYISHVNCNIFHIISKTSGIMIFTNLW